MEYIGVVNQNQHMQGFSSGDGFMYWSFTDSLVKTTMQGTVKCQREIRGGHLGDIDYFDGKIYGSYLGNALPSHDWDDWTGFKIYVFDGDDLSLLKVINMDICDYYKSISEKEGDTRGFRAIDGVSVAQPRGFSEPKLFVACAVATDERFSNQIILQCNLDGKYETEYHIPTGNTVFGIQNLDYDSSSGDFWFTTYGKECEYQPTQTLYRTDVADCIVKEKFDYITPYGFEALGNDRFFASLQCGVNGKRSGFCFEVEKEFFRTPQSERGLAEMLGIKL